MKLRSWLATMAVLSLTIVGAVLTTAPASAACDYSDADQNNGWGWDAEARRSCPPSENTGSPDTPSETDTPSTATVPDPVEAADNCDYSSADQNNGWGWDPVAGTSCPPRTTTESASDVSAGTGVLSKRLNTAGTESYWTSKRMRAAKDVLSLTSEGASFKELPPDFDRPRYTLNEPEIVTGRAFFTIPGRGDASCSASVVSTAGKDAVWTAGHCVHFDGEWFDNWVFVPAYDDGNAPFGMWTARQLWSLYGWTKGGNTGVACGQNFEVGDARYDMAVAVMNTSSGRHIADVVGGHDIAFNPAVGLNVQGHAYGFPQPAASGVNGGCGPGAEASRTFVECSSSLTSDPRGRAMTCPNFGAGSSGGAITTSIGGRNHLVGVISGGAVAGPDSYASPFFGQGAINLHNATKDL